MADCPDGKITLGHVPFLVEHLSRFAYKWKEIGTAVKFQPQDLRNIEASPSLIVTAPSSFMQRLVEEWLEGKYPHTAPPILANLLKALNSHTVGLGTLATQIRDSLPQYHQSVHANVFVIAEVSDQGDVTFNRIENVKVTEDTKVRLEIKTSSKEQLCIWRNTKNNDILSKHKPDASEMCSAESNVHILRADIDIDGSQYSCEINIYTSGISSITPPVTFRVDCPQLDKFKDSLASIYLAQPEVPRDSWPPVSNKTYINLALIKQQQPINNDGKYAHFTIRGDMDDIFHHKEIIEYKNIFDGLSSRSLFLIEGRPGSGKTTFVHKITRDWAASEVKGPMRLVLLVSLRVLNGWEKPVTLEDILHLLNLRIEEEYLNERKGKGVCFIFDGLDEFSPLEGKNSVIYKIINKIYLPESIVIVVSRPAALVNLRQSANKVVEVIGFPKEQIFEYVKYYPFSNTLKANQLKSYLLSHPNVLHMCYLPVHAAMVAFLFEVMGKVPRTETEIYKHFTRFTLMRSLSKDQGQDKLEDMDTCKLSGEERKLFDTICELALEKTIKKKQVLDQDEMKLHLQSNSYGDISLGLVTVDRTAGLYGFKNIYTFLHLTYQEYLAAHHISLLSDEDQFKLIRQYGDTTHMQVVWKFYCGLVNFEGHEYKIRALVSGRKKINLPDIQCAYESQQKSVCKCLMEELDFQIMLEKKYLTTTDFTALGYLLTNSTLPVLLSIIDCSMNIESVSALSKETEQKLPSVHTLYYKSGELENLMKLLSLQHSLDCVKISLTGKISLYTLDASGFSDVFTSSLASLKEFSLRNDAYSIDIQTSTDPNTDHKVTCLGDVRVSGCMIYIQGVRGAYLQTLRLEAYIVSITDLKLSIKYWPPRPKLLEFHFSPWNDYNVGFIAECASDLGALEKLILKNLDITGSDATLLAEKLSQCLALQELGISHKHVRAPVGIATVFTSLRNCSNLQKLFFSNIRIKTDGARVLASCLEYWPKLRELHLRGCDIAEEGAQAIANNIKHCHKLILVDILENNISTKTLQIITSSLQARNEVCESTSLSRNEVSQSHTEALQSYNEACYCCALL